MFLPDLQRKNIYEFYCTELLLLDLETRLEFSWKLVELASNLVHFECSIHFEEMIESLSNSNVEVTATRHSF